MEPIQKKIRKAFAAPKSKLGYSNPMQVPRILKVVVSAGTGSFKDPKKRDLALDRLAKITGQKPSVRGAKQSVASFKIRQGDPVGLQVTLRGKRMYDFLDKLLHVALPRTKDFRGIPASAIDEMGNLTIGVREHTIFPETSDEELKDVFGLAVTIVTNAKNKEETKAFFEFLEFPFRKE
ncbi:50S ribosomal protein L5 [Patescibacteria group bacterium]|nr:MAG: 50S ribosomal protein L5 [Patescibacteria group bacterium]